MASSFFWGFRFIFRSILLNCHLTLLGKIFIIINERSLFIFQEKNAMPRSSREQTEITHRHIVEIAYQLFIEKGYHATSMRDISQQVGLTVGAIYNHFPNKEELWKEVFFTKHPYREIFNHIKTAPGSSIAEIVRFAANAIIQELGLHPDLLNLMFTEIVEFNGSHMPDLFQRIVPEAMNMRPIIDGKQDKLRDLPIPILIRSFVGLFISYYFSGILLGGRSGMGIDPVSLDQFVDLFLFGLLADDDPTRLLNLTSGKSFTELYSLQIKEEA